MTDIDHDAAERIARDLGKSYQWPGDDAVRLVFAAYLDALEKLRSADGGASDGVPRDAPVAVEACSGGHPLLTLSSGKELICGRCGALIKSSMEIDFSA